MGQLCCPKSRNCQIEMFSARDSRRARCRRSGRRVAARIAPPQSRPNRGVYRAGRAQAACGATTSPAWSRSGSTGPDHAGTGHSAGSPNPKRTRVTMTSRVAARLHSPMIRTLRAGFMSVLALVGASAGARAQFAFEDEVLPPRVVAWRLADRGFSGLSRPRFDGRVYVVDAVGPAGAPVRLFVDPMTGAIVGRRPIGAPETVARLERPAPGFGWTEDEVVPRRAMRPVPSEDGPVARTPRRPAGEALRPDANPEGVNPDNVGRTAPPKRVARGALARTPELKPPPRTSPRRRPPSSRRPMRPRRIRMPGRRPRPRRRRSRRRPPRLPLRRPPRRRSRPTPPWQERPSRPRRTGRTRPPTRSRSG